MFIAKHYIHWNNQPIEPCNYSNNSLTNLTNHAINNFMATFIEQMFTIQK